MSSFIPSTEHFNSCEIASRELLNDSDFYFSREIKNAFPALGEKKYVPAQAELKQIFATLKRLTVLCVSLQYKHHYTGRLDQEIKEQTEILFSSSRYKDLNKYGLLKAIGCIHYQIETRHLVDIRPLTDDEENALMFIRVLKADLAYHLVTKSTQYENAPYSI